MPESESHLIGRYRQIRQRLLELEKEREALDAELVEIERKLPDDFEANDR